jgi:hypothetical protein
MEILYFHWFTQRWHFCLSPSVACDKLFFCHPLEGVTICLSSLSGAGDKFVFLSPSGGGDNLFVLTLWSRWQICFSVTLWSGWQLVCPHTLEWMILCSSVVCHLLERVTILMFSWVATSSVLKVSKNIIGLTAILIIMSFFTFKTDIILCIKISIILSINIVFLCVLHCRADMWGSLCQRLCYRHIIFNLQPVLQHI